MDEFEVIEDEPSEKFVHQLNKLLLGVGIGYIVSELVKASYDRFIVNRNRHSIEES